VDQVLPPTPPNLKRQYHVMAYDSARKVTIAFGGGDGVAAINETLEYDGTVWRRLEPAVSPPGRIDTSMVYDAKRKRMVLFGGDGPGPNDEFNDTWEFDGITWTEKKNISAPPPMEKHSMVYDADRNLVVLNGSGQTWEYDGIDWTQKDGTQPTAAFSASMVYDSTKKRIVLFGGLASNGQVIVPLNETWTYDGAKWEQLVSLSVPPPARFAAVMAFDSARSKTVLFGGGTSDENVFNDVWELDDPIVGTWVQRSPTLRPPARTRAAMAFDSTKQQMILFGGQTYVFPERPLVGDTWSYRGDRFANANVPWLQESPLLVPAFESAVTVQNRLNNSVLLVGKVLSAGVMETWQFVGGAWSRLVPAIDQSAVGNLPTRTEIAVAYDERRNRTVLGSVFIIV
jgi:hypothetical protein